MIHKVEIRQTVVGIIFVEADGYKQAEEAAAKYIQDEPNVANIDFDEILDYNVGGSLEASDDEVGDAEVIKAEDVL
ncbi:MAG: hypothetical protein NNC23_03290 [Candidatus Nanosynbacter sp. P2B_S1_bin.0.1]|jgi:hypothetical protein|nr:hypothetical protein [Candidatus Nanosynbacter sp. P2B_S1_bin.0.1]DAO58268.1 MAG TPA: hypothetical protein [Caudoviricetes sp.]